MSVVVEDDLNKAGNNVAIVDGELVQSVDTVSANNIILAEKVDGEWTATEAAKDVKSVSELLAAFEGTQSAADTVASARASLNDAVEAVYLNENDDYYSAFDPEAAVTEGADGDGKAQVSIDYDADVSLFETKALADADAEGAKEVINITFNSAVADSETVIIDGVTYTGATAVDTSAEASATAFVANYNGAAETKLVASAEGAVVTLTAKAVGDATYAVTGSSAAGTAVVTTEGVNADQGAGAVAQKAALSDDVAEAQADLEAFSTLVAEFENARTLNDGLSDADDAIEDADAAITDSVEDGGMGITLREGAEDFTGEDEVYLFSAEDSADEMLSGFGTTGEDKIYFGEGFSFVEIAGDDTISDNVGDAAAQEIFWDQQGDDLVLYVENETFGGNSAGTADVTTVTLTGVNAEGVNFENGFLSAGTAEVA